MAKSLRPNAKADAIAEYRTQVARLRKRLAEVVSIEFFGAIGREAAEFFAQESRGSIGRG